MRYRVLVEAQRTEGAVERVLSAMHGRRVAYDRLEATASADVWRIEIEAEVPDDRVHHVLATIDRQPVVLTVVAARVPDGDRPPH